MSEDRKVLYETGFGDAQPRALLIGVHETDPSLGISEEDFDYSMDELYRLACADYLEPVGQVTQKAELAQPALYLGPGKLEEAEERAKYLKADVIIFNDTLTPSQLRNLQKRFDVPIMDRTYLILEIFTKRARTREAKLQVELASLQYTRPRLIGMWEKQNRQGGTSGAMSTRGEGETQLELDRRQIDHRLAMLRRELKEVSGERETQRKRRRESSLPLVSLVGYTNAGKSTIMNGMISLYSGDEEKRVFEADMLFATLDTSVRKIETGGNRDFLLSDTVGFIHKLPADLVEAFGSTLEEIKGADLILHVVDCSDRNYLEHMKVTQQTLSQLGAGGIPVLTVFNKADRRFDRSMYPRSSAEGVYITAREEDSLRYLTDCILEKVYESYVEARFLIPYNRGDIVGKIRTSGLVISCEYLESGTGLVCRVSKADYERYQEYLM